jgi:hypothetical protein
MYFVLMIWRRRWNVWVSTAIVLVLGVVTNVSFASQLVLGRVCRPPRNRSLVPVVFGNGCG